MYTSKLKIKTSSVNAWRSLCWWPDLSDCLITSSMSQRRPQKKPADHNCWDDGEARREDLGWQSEDVVWRRHWRQTGRGRRGTGVLGSAISSTPSGRAWTRPAPVHTCLLGVYSWQVCLSSVMMSLTSAVSCSNLYLTHWLQCSC